MPVDAQMSNTDFESCPTAKHSFKIEFCNGWGFYGYVTDALEALKGKYPGTFNYFWYEDSEMSGRFILTLMPNNINATGDGTVVFKSEGSPPEFDWAKIFTDIDAILAAAWSMQRQLNKPKSLFMVFDSGDMMASIETSQDNACLKLTAALDNNQKQRSSEA